MPVPEPSALIYIRCNNFREGVSCPVKPGFYCAKVAVRNFCDLLVRLSFELPQNEHIPVVLRKLRDSLLDDLPEMPLAIHVVRPRSGVFELERTILILEVLLDGLEQHKRIT